MPKSPARVARAKVAIHTRHGNHEAAQEARRELAAANLERYVKETVDNAPPLTEQQRAKIVRILHGSGGANNA